MRKLKYLVITSLLLFMSCKEKEEKLDTEKLKQIANTYGQFAPDDAYENGSEFPYYGSENEWTRRQFSEAGATRLYKRRGQRQLLEILDGNLKKALELTEIRLKENNEDAESYFIQTIVYSVGKDNGYAENLREWFKAIYEIIFGDQDGPRMGFFISFFGIKETVELIKKCNK